MPSAYGLNTCAARAEFGAGCPATVIESVYLGQTVRYHVETVRGTPLIAACMQTGRPYPTGASIRLDWDAEAVWLIPEGVAARFRRRIRSMPISSMLTSRR
ncbi:TOBE domain-containing protein [Mesorhizobium sp. M0208]|uniref:TOBE domain-containing protein n=1 Tax=Mesorhizobium sp. M0208 TaxID=2956916 RepID=UPI00333DC668